MAHFYKGTGKAQDNIAKTPDLGNRCHFRCSMNNIHDVPSLKLWFYNFSYKVFYKIITMALVGKIILIGLKL